jgi:photosystem II stability/assembly factor-like uncharacterized protein
VIHAGFRFSLLWILMMELLSPLAGQERELFQELHWRMIGPHRGGRTVGAAGIPDQPNIFYVGVNNGGVWRTDDYGQTWTPIFDDQPTGSIGALALAPSDPSVLYVGSGEGLQRPDLSVGDGMFKSTDRGATWRHLGLSDAQQIGDVIVDPHDPNRVFVAVLGHPYGPNEQRGVFRSTDGGEKWEKVLYKDENTGAIALGFDPGNARIIYADLWSARLGPWENGEWEGKTSGLFKSTDGGSTWRQLTEGLPTAAQGLGRIGFAIAPSDPSRLYATVDAASRGGIYRSDDSGEHWIRVHSDERVWGRGSDFAEVQVDPKNRDVLFVANTSVYRSVDGGTTFTAMKGAPGGDDYHTIWINPLNADIMLLAADQGVVITVNGGRTWSSWYNQPTAQFYHVITDNQFPYSVYGGQQESGSAGVASRGNDGRITFREWHPVGADEWAYIAPDPLHPDSIYGGKVTRFIKSTGQVQNVAPEPIRSGMYRTLRTAPLVFSPVDPHTLYFASNVLFKTTSGGESWDIISPDLSREMPEVPASIGIFRTREMASQPRRGTIYALAPSPLDRGIIWAGTDDGTVHLTTDGGSAWKNVTPPALTAWSKVAGIEAGHFDRETAYMAVNRIRLDDMRPHLYRTHDAGKSWSEITKGLPADGPVNVVREDPVRAGLLFAGSERAVSVSFDDGLNWTSLRLNMPATSIRDLVIHEADLIVGTHGRSFWILDDITSLRQMNRYGRPAGTTLFMPGPATRVRWNLNTDTPLPPDEPSGENPPDGAPIDYYLSHDVDSVRLEILDQSGDLVRSYSSNDRIDSVRERALRISSDWIPAPSILQARAGMHRFIWDLHYAPPPGFQPWYPIAATPHHTSPEPVGPWVQPGTYTVTLNVDGRKLTQPVTVRMDPRVTTPSVKLQEQFSLSMDCYRGIQKVQSAVRQVHTLRNEIHLLAGKINNPKWNDTLSSFEKKLGKLEGSGVSDDVDVVYFSVQRTKSADESFTGLKTKLLYLMMLLQGADAPATRPQIAAVADEQVVVQDLLQRWAAIRQGELTDLNASLLKLGVAPLKAD